MLCLVSAKFSKLFQCAYVFASRGTTVPFEHVHNVSMYI